MNDHLSKKSKCSAFNIQPSIYMSKLSSNLLIGQYELGNSQEQYGEKDESRGIDSKLCCEHCFSNTELKRAAAKLFSRRDAY